MGKGTSPLSLIKDKEGGKHETSATTKGMETSINWYAFVCIAAPAAGECGGGRKR